MKSFLEALQQGQLLIFDGAMGTQLEERGMHPGPECNIKAPDVVADVHQSYIAAGANVLITNTLTANRLALERSGEADLVKDYNINGVKICKEVAGDNAYVAGDMSSTGQFLEPYGDYTETQFHEVFSEQAMLFAEAGVDLIIIETMTDLNETIVAIKACKDSTTLPIIASMSFDPGAGGPRTMMGNDVESCVRRMIDADVDIIGSNCGGITPEQMSELIAQMRQLTDKPLIAEPNAGLPELINGRAQFNLPPEEFAAGVIKCVEAGALLVGGCCGTTPAHIAALRRAVDSLNR
jgi:5-methyltetrahydrofolate--homocysteine methyltransferase